MLSGCRRSSSNEMKNVVMGVETTVGELVNTTDDDYFDAISFQDKQRTSLTNTLQRIQAVYLHNYVSRPSGVVFQTACLLSSKCMFRRQNVFLAVTMHFCGGDNAFSDKNCASTMRFVFFENAFCRKHVRQAISRKLKILK